MIAGLCRRSGYFALVLAMACLVLLGTATPSIARPAAAVSNSTPPSITGTPQAGLTLTAKPGVWSPTDAQLTYRWLSGTTSKDLVATGGTGTTYVVRSADVGKRLVVEVTGARSGYTSLVKTSSMTATVLAPGITAGQPAVSGTPRVASTLTATPGTWAPAGVTFAYQWLVGSTVADSVAVSGATSSTYVPVAADVGKRVSVRVTGSKTGYTTVSSTSGLSAVVVPGVLTATPVPTVSGTPQVDATLTAEPGTWLPSGVTFAYQWLVGSTVADSVAVSGATSSTYVPVAADVGKRVSVRVTGSKTGYTTVSSTSGLSAVVVPGVLTATPVPTVSGTPQVDATLTAEPGTWAPDGVQLSYQWFTGTTAADEVPVSGATASTYVPVEGDIGKRLAVEVTGSKLGYASTASTSVLGELVTPAPSIDAGTPTITGTAQVGRTLTADAGIWAPEGVELALQWLRDGTPVEGATSTTYALVGADVGRPVALRVTGTKPGFPTKVATSSETQAVAEGTQASTPTPTITGATGLGDVLTAVPGDWDTGVTVSYQWVRDGNALSGETAAQHTVTATDIGSSIRVTVTGTRAGYASQSVSSAPLPVTGAQTAGKIARALATFHAALGRVGTDPLDIFVGPSDSITEGNRASSIQKRWISVFRDGLRRSYQPSGVAGGFGYLDLMNSPKFPDNPSSYVNGAGVFDQGLGRQTLALFGATQTITVNDRFTDVDILYAGLTGTAGTFAYSVDGGPDVRVSTGGKAVSRGGYVERVSGLVAGPHRLVLHGGGGGYPSIIEGVMLYNGDRDRGIRLWEGGASGLTAVNYVAPTDAWAASLKEVHPDIVVLPIGSNDYALGTPAKDTEVRIREIIATIRARVDTDPSIVLVPYYERPTSGTAPWSTYEQMYARIASTDPKIVVFDLALLFGSYGSAQRVGLMSPDLLHPSDTGYALIADKLAAFVAPSPPG